MTSTDGFVRRGSPRGRTFGVAPYVPGRTTAEYLADGTLRAVEAADELAALAAYAAAHGLTVTGDPLVTMGGKRVRATLSDGREYVSRTLKAAHAELMESEPIVADPAVAPVAATADEPAPSVQTADHEPPPPQGALPEPTETEPAEPTPPPEPPEFLALDVVSPADVAGIRSDLQPLSWSIASALWGTAGEAPQSVQAVAERFNVTPGFVRMVAASVIHLAADERETQVT